MRIRSVIGDADRDPLLPADPMAAANRRIAILVMRDAVAAGSSAAASSPTPAVTAPAATMPTIPPTGPPFSTKR
jgi:chemotaxis protein MotB